jgi:hypothetical protein
MAYSNGARARVATAEGGGFNATLLCRHFILTISQSNVNAPTIGHLEPREHPAESHESLTVDESRYLLEYGHTFSPKGVTTAWVLNGQNSDPPPSELIDTRSDPLLTRTVLDTFQASTLKDKFQRGIIDYWEAWAKFMAPQEYNCRKDNLATQAEQCKAETFGHVCARRVILDNNVVSEIQTLQELQIEIGNLSYDPQPSNSRQSSNNNQRSNNDQPSNNSQPSNNDQPSSNSQPSNDQLLTSHIVSILARIHGLVVKALWRLKLLFLYESVDLVDNINRHEVLYGFKLYGNLIKTMTKCHLLEQSMDNTRPGVNAKQELSRLLDYHFAILARARMLNYCQQIHATLSVRNTGHNVLLS